jgi:ABC-2 family transporter protein
MRLVGAEFLKVRRRLGLVSLALGLTVVPALIMLMVTGGGGDDSGGMRSFADQHGVMAMLTVICGILVGATVGTADVTSGVIRDLVVTGRSRIDLYAARVPAGLALVLLSAAAGFAIVVATAYLSAGSVPEFGGRFGTVAPTTGVLVESGLWLALVGAVSFGLAFGVSSVVGSSGSSIAILLGLWLVITPLLQSFDPDGWLFDVLVFAGLDRVMPAALRAGDPATEMSLAAGISVLAAWTTIPLLAGAWRTMARDA